MLKKVRSHANVTVNDKEKSSSDADTDEKVGTKAPITQSHGCRSLKKPNS